VKSGVPEIGAGRHMHMDRRMLTERKVVVLSVECRAQNLT